MSLFRTRRGPDIDLPASTVAPSPVAPSTVAPSTFPPPAATVVEGERRRRSRSRGTLHLFDDEATTALRVQLANLAADLERSRLAEVAATQRAEGLAAALAEMQTKLAAITRGLPADPQSTTQTNPPSEVPTQASTPAVRRRWWQRRV